MNPEVDKYLLDGCGRCPLGGTPACKVNDWRSELEVLRRLVLECGLTEELKWKIPCYTFQNKNILLLAAFKAYCAISFFKGALLSDTQGMLEKPGENTQSVRLIKFRSTQDIRKAETSLKAYIFEAVEVEKAGVKTETKAAGEFIYPEELQQKLEENPALKSAFEALSPGRRRAYHIYFSAPKQSKTREDRIKKYIPKILNGMGMND